VQLDQPRSLNSSEKQILEALLGLEFPGVVELRIQVAHTMVVGRCDCGCPTVDLAVSNDVPRSSVKARSLRLAPVEAQVAPDKDEPPGEIILFVDDGRLSSLEYLYYVDSPPSRWPTLDRLTVVVRTD
jgi:hypothetical protein